VARLTVVAAEQFEALLDHYMQRGRDEAVRRLRVAVGQALTTIDAAPTAGGPFPGSYRDVARWGFRWIWVHRYWFGYIVQDGDAVVTNIFYETANIPKRVMPRQTDR
jgi:plasmid stabilization system protein ParE